MNLYEMNQHFYSKLPDKTEEELKVLEEELAEHLTANMSKYYLMLCNELKYYTVYTWNMNANFFRDTKKMAWEIIDVAKTLGHIKDINFHKEDNAVEFWIYNNDEVHLYYLFDYADGVIEV